MAIQANINAGVCPRLAVSRQRGPSGAPAEANPQMKAVGRPTIETLGRRYLPPVVRRTIQVVTGVGGRRSYAARWMVFPVLQHLTPAVMVRDGGIRCLAWTSDMVIGRSLFANREGDSVQLAQALAAVATRLDLPAEPIFVDIGANIGTASLAALHTGGFRYAIAVEPDSRSLDLLRANAALNEYSDRIHIVPAAASDIHGEEAEIELDLRNFGNNIILAPSSTTAKLREGASIQRTRLVRLDRILPTIPEFSAANAFYWIDVQGHEGHVLQGLGNLLSTAFAVVIELSPTHYALPAAMEEVGGILASSHGWFAELGRQVGELRSTAELPGFVAGVARSKRAADIVVFGAHER